MKNYLQSLVAKRKKKSATELLWEVGTAFDEADPKSPARTLALASELRDLLYFVKADGIAPLLKNKRRVLKTALAFSEEIKDLEVSAILKSALSGNPLPAAEMYLSMPGQERELIDVDTDEYTMFDGKDWGGTDIALSFAMDNFESALLDKIIDSSDKFDLLPPLALQRRNKAETAVAAAAKKQSALALFTKLVSAKKPRMEAGEWEDAENREYGNGVLIPVKHVVNPAAPATTIAKLKKRYGVAAKELLDLYAVHNGAELFKYKKECGFYLGPIEDWPELHSRATEWAEKVTWQDERDQIPKYLYSAIAFGAIPGDNERWLLITEGNHAGCVMLSDTDLIDETPRFETFGHFISALLNDTGRILNCGGQVRYLVKGEELFPIRYICE
jgi:hypothetical protein